MPEGDTILRTARNLDRWLTGRRVTDARSPVLGAATAGLIGREVTGVEAHGKVLLIHFGPSGAARPVTLRTHQRMLGTWHTYLDSAKWRLPESQMRVVIAAGPRLAVCFRSPVVELFATRDAPVVPGLRTLGPDLLGGPVDMAEVWRRAGERMAPDAPIAELLLDQAVAAGIGNIYRSESLFVCGVNPWQTWVSLGPAGLGALLAAAAQLMAANVDAPHDGLRGFGGGRGQPWVYRRGGRPCRRCRATIQSAPIGRQPRTVWWCPRCQPAPAPGGPGATDEISGAR